MRKATCSRISAGCCNPNGTRNDAFQGDFFLPNQTRHTCMQHSYVGRPWPSLFINTNLPLHFVITIHKHQSNPQQLPHQPVLPHLKAWSVDMAIHAFLLAAALLALSSFHAIASDPSLLQDFCVVDKMAKGLAN